MIKGIVYGLYEGDKEDNIKYIGVSLRTVEERLKEHIKESKYSKSKTKKLEWIRSTNDIRGKILFSLEVDSMEDLYAKEIEQIKLYKDLGCNLLNSNSGGIGNVGYEYTKEDRIKISEASKLQWSLMSEEELILYKRNKSIQMTGNSHRKGKKDPLHRILSKKIGMKGKSSPTWKGYLIQMDENFKEIARWESIQDAALSINRGYKNIWSSTWKKTKDGFPMKAGGYYWKYENK